jgi:uncharacterized sulfatase
MVRSVRDKRYVYLRHYMPHKIYGQHVAYMFETPTTQVWEQLYDAGKLQPPQTHFWERKPAEELFDLQNDPDEVRNLAGSPEHQEVLARLRAAQQELAVRVRDVGFLPEGEIHSRSEGSTPYDMGHDDARYPLGKIMAAAEAASSLKPDVLPDLRRSLQDDDSAVRYWAALGILMRGEDAVKSSREALRGALGDSSAYVRIVAAQALGQYGEPGDLQPALGVLFEAAPMDRNGVYVSIAALNAIDELDAKAASLKEAVAKLPTQARGTPQRMGGYVPRLIEKIMADLK